VPVFPQNPSGLVGRGPGVEVRVAASTVVVTVVSFTRVVLVVEIEVVVLLLVKVTLLVDVAKNVGVAGEVTPKQLQIEESSATGSPVGNDWRLLIIIEITSVTVTVAIAVSVMAFVTVALEVKTLVRVLEVVVFFVTVTGYGVV